MAIANGASGLARNLASPKGSLSSSSGSGANQISTENRLKAIAREAEFNVKGTGNARVDGTLKHTYSQKQIDSWQSSSLNTEISYDPITGQLAKRTTPGSVRLDVVEGPLNYPSAIYDFKFGKAGLTDARINQIRSIFGNPNLPVFEIRP